MNSHKLLQSIRSGWSPAIAIIALTTLAAIIASIYFLSSGLVIIFQNLFYLPIIIACVFYGKKGFVFSVVLSFIYLFLVIAFTRDSGVIIQALIRLCIFVGVAGGTTYLSIKRKQAEADLRDSEERFSRLANATWEGIIIHKDGIIFDVNESALKMFGYSAEEVIGKSVIDFLAPESTVPALQTLKEGATHNQLYLEVNVLRKDKTILTAEALGRPISYKKIDARVIAIRDITERKQMEMELLNARNELEQRVVERTTELAKVNETLMMEIRERIKSEQRYRIVADNTYDWEFWLNPKYDVVIYTSPSCERITGYLPHEFQQNPKLMLEITHPDDLHMFKEHYFEEYKKDFSSLRELEFRIIHKDGSVRWIGHVCGPVFDNNGAYAGIRGSNRDISDHKRAEEENLLLERRLQQSQKMEAIGTLAGGIAHDFNNILGAISGFTGLALEHVPADGKAKIYLKRVLVSTRRAVDLVSQILTFSHKTETKLQPLRLKPIIEEVVKLVRAATPATIDIRQNIKAEPDLVMADVTYIHQVVMNLCMNANHAMRKNGGVLSVNLTNESIVEGDLNHTGINPGHYLKLKISDTGEGIEPGVVDKIFEPFFTTKKQGEGTGLGLAVVHGIVKSLGGEIKVESRPGQVTSFEIWFPLLADSLLESFPEEEDTISIKGSGKILFIDDEEDLVEMTRLMLEGLGYEVTATQSSAEALELFRTNPNRFDLVITDQTMPEMTGMALAQEIMGIKPGIPIILCTGFGGSLNAEEVKNAGIRDYFIKPLVRRNIAESIHNILKNSRS